MTDKEENYFVKISSPSELRRNLLESSKEMIQILYNLEDLKKIRKEKLNKIQELGMQIKDISDLVTKLKFELPKTSKKGKTKKEKKTDNKKTVKKETQKAVSELQKLQHALEDIESKLDNLS